MGNQKDVSPGLFTETSLSTGEFCGQQTATRITSRITSPTTPIPINADFGAFEVEAANEKRGDGLLVIYLCSEQLNEGNNVHTSLHSLSTG